MKTWAENFLLQMFIEVVWVEYKILFLFNSLVTVIDNQRILYFSFDAWNEINWRNHIIKKVIISTHTHTHTHPQTYDLLIMGFLYSKCMLDIRQTATFSITIWMAFKIINGKSLFYHFLECNIDIFYSWNWILIFVNQL